MCRGNIPVGPATEGQASENLWTDEEEDPDNPASWKHTVVEKFFFQAPVIYDFREVEFQGGDSPLDWVDIWLGFEIGHVFLDSNQRIRFSYYDGCSDTLEHVDSEVYRAKYWKNHEGEFEVLITGG